MNNLYKTSLLILLFLLPLEILYPQPVTQEWVARYNGPDNLYDGSKSLAMDKWRNVYVTGDINTQTQGNNIVTVKYNSSGVQQWAATYTGPGGTASVDIAWGIAVDSLGSAYVTGYSGLNFGPYDIITIKYNTSGVQQWVRIYDGGGNDGANAICLDKQGNIYVTGGSSIGSNVNAVIIKYSPAGDSLWVRKFILRNGSGLTVVTDDSSNVFVGGYSYLNPYIDEFLLIKYNSAGALQWYSFYTAPGYCGASLNKIALDKVGNCYAVGTQGNCTADTTRIMTLMYNRNGVRQWTSLYKGPAGNGSSDGRSIAVDSSGANIYVSGFGLNIGTLDDYVTIKYNMNGDSLWVRRYNGTGNNNDEAYDLAMDDSLNVYITGRSMNNNNNFDFCTIKYSSSGMQRWIMRYPGSATNNFSGKSILVD